MRSRGIGRWVVVAATPLIALVATAQDRSQTFSGSAEVVAVEIPVQVLRDGEPVRGLKAADFEVFDGKKKQAVTGFEILDLGTLDGANPATEIPVAGRRHFLLLFDLTFSEPTSIVRAREAAKKLLADLHPTDLVAVATFSTNLGSQLVIGFTTDREQVALAIDTLGMPQLIDRGSGDPLRLALSTVQGRLTTRVKSPRAVYGRVETLLEEGTSGRDAALLEAFGEYSAMTEHADRAQQAEMVQRLTGSFAQLARLMSSVEGRKYVVLLSQGYDATLLTGTVDDEQRKLLQEEAVSSERALRDDSNDRFGDTKSANRVERMLAEFRRADCIVQAVDISGLRAEGDLGGHLASGKDSLLQIAKDTGQEVLYPFLRAGQPYVPASVLVLAPGAESPVVLIGYGLQPGPWKAEAQVLSPDGETVRASGELKIDAAAPGAEGAPAQAEGTFRAPSLPAGSYLLKVTLTDGSGAAASNVSPFRLAADG